MAPRHPSDHSRLGPVFGSLPMEDIGDAPPRFGPGDARLGNRQQGDQVNVVFAVASVRADDRAEPEEASRADSTR